MNEINFKSKPMNSIPKGAKIVKREKNTTVEEIENGFIVIENYDIKFNYKNSNEYLYFTKKYYVKDNPISIDETKMLADNFE